MQIPEPRNDGDADGHEEEFSKRQVIDEEEDVVRNQHHQRKNTLENHPGERNGRNIIYYIIFGCL